MKRRQLMGYAGAGLVTTLVTNFGSQLQANAQSNASLSIRWLGHTSFLFSGGGIKILSNPFHQAGCTAGYRSPKEIADLVIISSQLRDEGEVEGLPGNPKLMYQAGVYEFKKMKFQGFRSPRNRTGGRRFDKNIAWTWEQAGVKILHLGGAAAPISDEQKILMIGPDVLLVPVGGGAKAYSPAEAKQAIETIKPKLVIPTHYRTQAADTNACDLVALKEFTSMMDDVEVRRSNSDSITVKPASLPKNRVIQVLSYNF